ncbi:MAG: hypothetical protein Q8R28_18860 [Dehalococcoidia bacterium]|nr:hypothetical protein [Dehalococcoidia bacterium]
MDSSIQVVYGVNDAMITAQQRMPDGSLLPIGRGRVINGVAEIPFFLKPDPQGPVILSASMNNAVSVLLTPPNPGEICRTCQ